MKSFPHYFLMWQEDNSELRFPGEPIWSHQLAVKDEQRWDVTLKLYVVHKLISNTCNPAHSAVSGSECNKTETSINYLPRISGSQNGIAASSELTSTEIRNQSFIFHYFILFLWSKLKNNLLPTPQNEIFTISLLLLIKNWHYCAFILQTSKTLWSVPG